MWNGKTIKLCVKAMVYKKIRNKMTYAYTFFEMSNNIFEN